jgi:hypothetical protein
MLNNVVNLVKYGVFILSVVVMFFKLNSGHCVLLWFETKFKLINVSVIICDVHALKII